MDKIEWTDKLSVGVKLLDEQHKRIIEIINLLIEKHEDKVEKEIVSQILGDLVNYAVNHLKDEEKLMSENGYPDYEEQKDMHDEYKLKVVSFHAGDSEVSGLNMLEYLRSWWIGHILKEDMKYKTFFNKKGLH